MRLTADVLPIATLTFAKCLVRGGVAVRHRVGDSASTELAILGIVGVVPFTWNASSSVAIPDHRPTAPIVLPAAVLSHHRDATNEPLPQARTK